MNRATAHCTVSKSRKDIPAFLALLAHAAHAGRILVHAFGIFATHFHLQLRKGHLTPYPRDSTD